MSKVLSMVGLLIYFAVLMIVIIREKKSNTVEEYFFAGRDLPFWALSITFIASWWGAGSALSTADLAYADGLGSFWYYGVPVLISTFLMILGAKAIRKVGYMTQGKMMEARYNQVVSKMLSLLILVFMIFTAASQMVGIGMFFGTYMGLNYEIAVLAGTSMVLIYSLFGGFRGVVFTDIIQFVLLLLSAILVFVTAMMHSGGVENIYSTAISLGKTDYMSLSAGASKYMMYVVTFGCAWMIQANVWQRISATKDDQDAKKMTIMSFFAYIPLYLIVVFTGMAAIALFDELPSGGVVTAIVTEYMSPAFAVLVFIGISAAIMSTMDSLINTGALTMAVDLSGRKKSEQAQLLFSKWSTIIVTMIALIIALNIRSILEVSWIASDIITTGAFIPLVLGFLWRRGNSVGAISSMVVGFIFCIYNLLISLGFDLPSVWKPQSAQQVLIGVSLSIVVYISMSLITAPEYEKADFFIMKAGIRKVI